MVKYTQAIRPTNCLSVFDYFVGLALKGLNVKVVNIKPLGSVCSYYCFSLSPRKCLNDFLCSHVPVRKCAYVTCKIKEQLCGSTCYDPKVMVRNDFITFISKTFVPSFFDLVM